MELRRVGSLPPYVFAAINELKLELRRAGEDVIDLGFGNPDLPSPEACGREATRGGAQPAQPPLLVESRDPEPAAGDLRPVPPPLRRRARSRDTGADDDRRQGGLAHLMWVLLQPGDAAIVPGPSYPIHLFAPVFAGAVVEQVPMGLQRICSEAWSRRSSALAPGPACSSSPSRTTRRQRRSRPTSCSASSTSHASRS